MTIPSPRSAGSSSTTRVWASSNLSSPTSGRITPPPRTRPEYWSYIPGYVSPADPSFARPDALLDNLQTFGDLSYPANWQAFRPGFTLTGSFADGKSSTTAFAERFARCGRTVTWWTFTGTSCVDLSTGLPKVCSEPRLRRPTFADPNYDDVLPITVDATTPPSVPGRTFQVSPGAGECDYRVPQTPHRAGMLTTYFDGSVRTTSSGISPAVFWAAVTPTGGELSGAD